ncbi:TonB-dependent receptor [Neorhizobium galegae]|uniref:TonB-dependent receptor n=1 Tax=Neorhizobium galegae TaxID=399 RepID=UPI000622849B|nr:TonB-dependent receptor [Neorhizobium galegae]KAB1123353.1 TonB-dependent receptor [Neorhizobium galegae]MCQ1807093.1 TonB-dependent receptor [Neorhizobium galegae]CDZ59229.1 HasR protein [Neorhizobium galegae bv. orientalis]
MSLRGPLFSRHVRIALGCASWLGGMAPAIAQQPAQGVQSQQVAVSIPAGPLESALLALGRQTDLRLVYRSEITAGKTTGGVTGSLTPSAALSRLLSGTGVSFRSSGGNTVTLEAADAGSAARPPDASDDTTLAPIVLRDGDSDGVDAPYETAGSTSYITAEQIERFRGSTAGDIFKNTPGVISANNHNGGAVNVNIRGLQGQNRVRVAIDGTQQTTTTWRGYAGVDDRTYIDPDLIGGVSISKGPSGGAAGAGVNGGVVGIRTLNAKDVVEDGKQYGGRIKIGAQDNTTSDFTINSIVQQTDQAEFFDFTNGNGSVALATVQDNFDLVIAAARRYRGNYFAGSKGPTTYNFNNRDWDLSYTKPGEEVWNTSSESTSFLAKGTIHMDDDQSLELGYVHYEAEYGEAMSSLLFTQPETFRQAPLSNVVTDTFTSRYRYNPDDTIDLKANIWMSIVDQMDMSTGLAFYLPPLNSPITSPPGDDPRYAMTHTYGGDISNTSKFDTDYGNVSANYGVSYLFEDIDSRPYRSRTFANTVGAEMIPSVGSSSIASVFTQAEWEATDWLKFNAGLRYDHYWLKDHGALSKAVIRERDDGRLNPSISATIEPLDGLQFYALYAEGVRPPTMRETMGNDGNVRPNPYLEQEIAKNWEVGINLSKEGLVTADDSARLKFSYFNNNYTDYISRVPLVVPPPVPPGTESFTFENLKKARFSGIEVSASYDLGFLYAEGSLTYYTGYEFCRRSKPCSDTTVDNDYAANHMPPEIMKRLTIGTRLFEDKLQAGIRITQAGARMSPVTRSARQYTGMWVPYTTVDAFATYKITENLTFDLQAENLTDRFYIDALDGWNPAPGRTIRASLTAKF